MTRRSLLLSLAQRRRPNILFALADDHSWPHAGAYGDRGVRTPTFDRIAREGALFTHAYCVSPSCTPSRSSILTGRHIWQLEEAGVLYGTMPPKLPLYTHRLEDAGYHVGFTGKGWSPGDWRAAGLRRNPTGKEYNGRVHATRPREGIDSRDYAANFDDFLRGRKPGQPFCFWFGATEPHRDYQKGAGLALGKTLSNATVPAFLPDTPEVRSDLLDYYSEVEWLDTQLGRMITSLERAGELDNTLIVATSDNGFPFPRAKVNLYEMGLHMPLAIRWGGRFKGGRRVDDFVSHIDFAPTFYEAAGVPAPSGVMGRSLLPILDTGKPDPSRDGTYGALERHTWCRPDGATYPMRTIRTRRYRYIHNFAPDRWPTGGPNFISSNQTYHGDVDGCPTKDFMVDPANQKRFPDLYQLAFGKRPAEEFYDLDRDPHQLRNVASDPAYRAEKDIHRTRLMNYLGQTRDPRVEGRDPWQTYVYHQTTGYGARFNRALSQ